MGSTTSEVLGKISLRYANSGIVGAVFIGLGRALGETMAVAFLIGSVYDKMPHSLFDPGISIASLIANTFNEATEKIHVARSSSWASSCSSSPCSSRSSRRSGCAACRGPREDGHELRRAAAAGRPSVRRRSVTGRKVADYVIKVLSVDRRRRSASPSWASWSGRSSSAASAALNWDFFTKSMPQDFTVTSGAGMANAIVGTLVITGVRGRSSASPSASSAASTSPSSAATDAWRPRCACVANVVMGVPVHHRRRVRLRHPGQAVRATTPASPVPWLSRSSCCPVMARTTEDILNLVPNELRESALAMGVPRWRVTLGVVVPGRPWRPHHRRDLGHRAGWPARRPRFSSPRSAARTGCRACSAGRLLRRSDRQPHQDHVGLHEHAVSVSPVTRLGRGSRHHHRRAGNEHPGPARLPARPEMVGTQVDDIDQAAEAEPTQMSAKRQWCRRASRWPRTAKATKRTSTPSPARSRCATSTSTTARRRRSSTTRSRSSSIA